VPALYLMTWDSEHRRWRKLYKGARYVVSCRQLGAVETKEGSYRAANEWWRSKQVEIDGTRLPHPHAETLELLARQRDWARQQGEAGLAAQLTGRIEATERLAEDEGPEIDDPSERIEAARLFGIEVPEDLDPLAARMIFGDGRLWRDRLERDRPAQQPDDMTIGVQVERWISTQQARVEAGEISPGRFRNDRIVMHHVRDHFGAEAAVKTIDEKRWAAFHADLMARIGERYGDPGGSAGWSRDYANKVFNIGKMFVRFLWENGLTEIPKNLDSRTYKIGRETKAVATMTVEEVRRLVVGATGQLRLHILLMANCGMLPTDIAELRNDQVNWAAGRIVRKRTKTAKHETVPTVDYRLWSITADLLRQHRSGGDIVLLTSKGTSWVERQLIGGHLKSKNVIQVNYQRLQARLGITQPLKLFRKTSASLLETHPNHGRYASHWLGHSPRTIADRHYVAPSRERFDEAVVWLGQQYGFETRTA
jgi:integrase